MGKTKYYWNFQLVEKTYTDGLYFMNEVARKIYDTGILVEAVEALYALLADELKRKYPEGYVCREPYTNGVSVRDRKSNTIVIYAIKGANDGLEECDETV